jgi:hypothetical protein
MPPNTNRSDLLAFGRSSGLRDRLRLGRTPVRDVGLALVVSAGAWAPAAAVNAALNPVAPSQQRGLRAPDDLSLPPAPFRHEPGSAYQDLDDLGNDQMRLRSD